MMQLEFPTDIADRSHDEQVACLSDMPEEHVNAHFVQVGESLTQYLPDDVRELGARLVEVASAQTPNLLPLPQRYDLLYRLHGYAAAYADPDLGDAQRYNARRSLGSLVAMAERGLLFQSA